MSRYTTLQRFVRPATQHPHAFTKAIFRQTLIALSGPINIRFISQIGNILEAKNLYMFG